MDFLLDINNIEKDTYGNYIITEEMFDNPDMLPVNDNGVVDYIYYYDDNGVLLNPLPELYTEHSEYFEYGD